MVLDGAGRVIESGTHEALMNSPEGHFRRLVMRQMVVENSAAEDSLENRVELFNRKKKDEDEEEVIFEEEEEEEVLKNEVLQKKQNSDDGFVDIPLRTLSMSNRTGRLPYISRGGGIRKRIRRLISSPSSPSPSSSNYSTLKVILRILRLLCQSRTAVTLGVTCAILFGLCVPIYAFIFGNFVNVFTNRTSSSEVEVNSSSFSSITTTLSPLPEAIPSSLSAEEEEEEDFIESPKDDKSSKESGEKLLKSTKDRFKQEKTSSSTSSTTFGLDNDYLREQARNYGFQFLGLAFFAFLSSFLQVNFKHSLKTSKPNFLFKLLNSQNSFFHIASQRLVTALRLLAFNSMLAKPITWHEKPQNSASRLCTTLANDPSDIQSSTGPRIAMLCQAGAALVVAVAFGLYTCWSLSLVALAFVPLIAYSSSSRVELFGEQNTKEAERNAEAAAVGAEAMANIRTVASLHREAFFERYYASLLEMNVR